MAGTGNWGWVFARPVMASTGVNGLNVIITHCLHQGSSENLKQRENNFEKAVDNADKKTWSSFIQATWRRGPHLLLGGRGLGASLRKFKIGVLKSACQYNYFKQSWF